MNCVLLDKPGQVGPGLNGCALGKEASAGRAFDSLQCLNGNTRNNAWQRCLLLRNEY